MNSTINTGGLASPKDYRDSIASASVPTLPPSIILPPVLDTQLGPVQMQGHIPSCVSHSAVDVLKLYWFRKTGNWIDFSPRFLDILSDEPDIPLDGGRRPRTVFKIMANVGCCTNALLPNDVNLSIADYRNHGVITQAMKDEATQYKIPGFISIGLDFYTFRQSLYYYGALSALFMVGKEMYIPSWQPKDTNPLRTPAKVDSGHQMTPKGWSNSTLNKLRNEWSIAWGVNGETEYDWVAWAPFMNEAWAIAAVPLDITNFLKTLPSPSNFHYIWNTDLHIGDNNDDVKFAQIALMILGLLKPINPTDLGIYGPKTAAAVLAYQHSKSIFPSNANNVGPKTRAALNKQFAF